MPHPDQALPLQTGQGLAQGWTGDAHLLGQDCLRREALTWLENPISDELQEILLGLCRQRRASGAKWPNRFLGHLTSYLYPGILMQASPNVKWSSGEGATKWRLARWPD